LERRVLPACSGWAGGSLAQQADGPLFAPDEMANTLIA
jgi:cytochrome c peroxidase